MSKVMRTILSLVFSLMLLSALTMAQTGGNNAEKDKNKEHHSRLAKVAFWRHHNDADKNAKPAQATPAPSKQAQAKPAQVKPVSAKQVAGKNQKQEQHASNMSKPAVKKAHAVNKTKPHQKAKDPKTVSVKQ
jgi:Ni/Co efflux regulator RcnB